LNASIYGSSHPEIKILLTFDHLALSDDKTKCRLPWIFGGPERDGEIIVLSIACAVNTSRRRGRIELEKMMEGEKYKRFITNLRDFLPSSRRCSISLLDDLLGKSHYQKLF